MNHVTRLASVAVGFATVLAMTTAVTAEAATQQASAVTCSVSPSVYFTGNQVIGQTGFSCTGNVAQIVVALSLNGTERTNTCRNTNYCYVHISRTNTAGTQQWCARAGGHATRFDGSSHPPPQRTACKSG